MTPVVSVVALGLSLAALFISAFIAKQQGPKGDIGPIGSGGVEGNPGRDGSKMSKADLWRLLGGSISITSADGVITRVIATFAGLEVATPNLFNSTRILEDPASYKMRLIEETASEALAALVSGSILKPTEEHRFHDDLMVKFMAGLLDAGSGNDGKSTKKRSTKKG